LDLFLTPLQQLDACQPVDLWCRDIPELSKAQLLSSSDPFFSVKLSVQIKSISALVCSWAEIVEQKINGGVGLQIYNSTFDQIKKCQMHY